MDSVRQMLGLDDQMGDRVIFHRQTIIDNVSKLTPELLDEVNQIVVAYGHQEVGAAAELYTRADSFVVETDVHWPTDVRLLWDAIQCVVLLITQAASRHGIAGWRKYRGWLRAVHAHFAPVRLARRWRTKEGVQAYLEICQVVVKKVKSTVQVLQQQSVPHPEITRYLTHCERQIEQVERRLRETVKYWVFRVPRRIFVEYPSIALDGHIRTTSYDRPNRIQRTLTGYP